MAHNSNNQGALNTIVPEIVRRKNEHIDVVLSGRALPKTSTGLERVEFEHCALPEIDLDKIDLSCTFLQHSLCAPLLISSMTGGPDRADQINSHLAEAAAELGIAFAVGSQRVALETQCDRGLGKRLRSIMGKRPLLSNLGAAQLTQHGAHRTVRQVIDMIEADAVIIHLNPLQEALQHGGDTQWSGILEQLATLASVLDIPLVVKEIGCGISGTVARQLIDSGVSCIDVAGRGGTSWAAVEGGRARDEQQRAVAMAFATWGISTAHSIVAVRQQHADLPIIASGGIRDGIDVARAIRLGANLAGQAAATLPAALTSTSAVINHFQSLITQLRVACFCTGSRNLEALAKAPLQRPINLNE